jgi:hypothetical protein
MNIGCRISEKRAARLAKTRDDREPSVQDDADWLDRIAVQFRLARILQVPVGFEDETGFHPGVPWIQETQPPVAELKNIYLKP